LTSGIHSQIIVKPSYGLQDQDIERMLKESLEYAEEDVKARALREQQVEADRMVNALRAALTADGPTLLKRDEFIKISAALDALLKVAKGKDIQAIKKAIVHLDDVTQEFAQRRMDSAIKKAMKGHRVDEFTEKS